MFADIHGYATFRTGTQPSRIFELLNASGHFFKVFESEPKVGYQWQYVSFAGEARLSGETDDREWLAHVESRLKEIDFLSVVIFISYEDASAIVCSYFRIDGIRKLVSKIDQEPISETTI